MRGVVFEGEDGIVEFEGCSEIDGVAAVRSVHGYCCYAVGCCGCEDGVWFVVVGHFGGVEFGLEVLVFCSLMRYKSDL